MIKIGDPAISDLRQKEIKRGRVTAIFRTDFVTRLWLGSGGKDVVSFVFTEIVTQDRSMFLMGRIDYRGKDGKAGRREPMVVACGPGKVREFTTAVQDALRYVARGGDLDIVVVPINGNMDKYQETFEALAMKFGWSVSFARYSMPESA